MLNIFLVAKTEIDSGFLQLTNKILRRSLTNELDKYGIKWGNLGSYISALGEMQNESSNPTETQREAGVLLQHVSISFLVVTTKEALFEIGTQATISIVQAQPEAVMSVSIMTGTLEQWRTIILNGCTDRASIIFRLFATKILNELEAIGLGRIFENYSKRVSKDGNLLLTLKS